MKILISSSMRFQDDFLKTAKQLNNFGFEAIVPDVDAGYTKRQYIDRHLARLKDSDALLVTNYRDDSGYGYVGASGFIEVGWAFALGKKIYLLHDINPTSPYAEDLDAVVTKVLNGDLTQLQNNIF